MNPILPRQLQQLGSGRVPGCEGYWNVAKARRQISLDYATRVVRGSVHQAGHEPRSITLRHM